MHVHRFLRHLSVVVSLFSCVSAMWGTGEMPYFYTLNMQNGLGDNRILSTLQLFDGRMVAVTPNTVDVYNGHGFDNIHINHEAWMPIPAYDGATHLFADVSDRLWIKQHGRIYCFDLRTMQQVTEPWDYSDFFIDGRGNRYFLKDSLLLREAVGDTIVLPRDAGSMQDLICYSGETMVFFSSGTLIAYRPDGSVDFRAEAYDAGTAAKYDRTSLVVAGCDGFLYQVRNGAGCALLLSFDTEKRVWTQMLHRDTYLHTLTQTPTGILYLTTPSGYLRINPATGEREEFRNLHLPDGTILSTGINTVCPDREGGIWLGTYENGLLYTSPHSGLFDTKPIDIDVYPILTTIYLNGHPLHVGTEYDGRCLIDVTPPYVQQITLKHNQNSLAFQFCTMNYVRPRSTCYRYRLLGADDEWHTLSADSVGRMVDDNGILYLPLVALSPGDYTLEVMASTNPTHWNEANVRRIRLTVEHPWWQTPTAYALYALLIILVVLLSFRIYRHLLQRRSREAMLLLQIQNLIEQVNRNEHSEAAIVLNEPTAQDQETESEPSAQDKEFMARATRLVEQHLSSPQYGVKHLAADLCMERTGLYKKLTLMMQQSPVAFIRSIRLHRAAEMLQSGDMTVTDVAERSGFCSTSYFSKCFQKEFGCKPSEYIGR